MLKTMALSERGRLRLKAAPMRDDIVKRALADDAAPVSNNLPAIPIYEVIPIRNYVAQRTSVVAERYSTIHAPTRLLLKFFVAEVLMDFVPIHKANLDRSPRRKFPLML